MDRMLGIAGTQPGRFQFAHSGEPLAFSAHEHDGDGGHSRTRTLEKPRQDSSQCRKSLIDLWLGVV
jgi:hypothetical protein